jgi:hypothetical protein
MTIVTRQPISHVTLAGFLLVSLAGCAEEPLPEEVPASEQEIGPDRPSDVGEPAAKLPDELLLARPSTIEMFETEARRRGDFGGLWVEGDDGDRPIIHIARTSAAFAPTLRSTDAEVVLVDVEWSLAELEAELARVLEADRYDDGISFGAYVDPRINRIVLEPGLDAPELLTDRAVIAERLGANPEMLKIDEPIRVSTTGIIGGDYSAGGCTAGFPVTCPFFGGVIHGALTAGHCSDSGYYASGCNFDGASWPAVTAGGVDRQVHLSWGCGPTRRLVNGVYYSSQTSNGYTGQSIRRYGRTTGTRGGTIHTLNWYYAGVDGPWILSSTGLNCAGGDSGGPWYTYYGKNPLGITRGTTGERCFASKIPYALYGTGCWVY